jgi:hypothetical protein
LDFFTLTRKFGVKVDNDGSAASKVNMEEIKKTNYTLLVLISKNKNEQKSKNFQLKTPKVSLLI